MTMTDGASPDQARHAIVCGVLGVPVRFEARTAAALAPAEAAYPSFAGPSASPRARVRLRLEPRRGAAGGAAEIRVGGRSAAAGAVRIRTDAAGRLVLRAPDAAGRAYARSVCAACRLSPTLLDDPHRLRELLDTLVLWLVTRRDRQPVHGACVAAGERGVVLAGPSGAGKSTLAYLCVRAGLRLIDDDAAYVQLDPAPRVWGRGRPLHLGVDAAARFPELAGCRVVVRTNGKRRLVVDSPPASPAHRTPDSRAAPSVERAALCLLEAGGRAVACRPVTADDAVAAILADLPGGFSVFRDTLEPRLRALAANGAWRLRLSDDPVAALPHIREMIAQID